MMTAMQTEAVNSAVESVGNRLQVGSEALVILVLGAVGLGFWVYFVVMPDRKAAREERLLRAQSEAEEKQRVDEINLLQAKVISELSTITAESRDHAAAARDNTLVLLQAGLIAANSLQKVNDHFPEIDLAEEVHTIKAVLGLNNRASL